MFKENKLLIVKTFNVICRSQTTSSLYHEHEAEMESINKARREELRAGLGNLNTNDLENKELVVGMSYAPYNWSAAFNKLMLSIVVLITQP